MTRALPANEFPTLDLDTLEDVPARPAVLVPEFEREDLAALLALWMPTIVHARRRSAYPRLAEHQFIDTATGDAVRYLLTVNSQEPSVEATVAESQPHGLWDRLVVLCDQWRRANRSQRSGLASLSARRRRKYDPDPFVREEPLP